jgi:hypothetical protein
MRLSNVLRSSGDLGSVIKIELEEAVSPITDRVSKLEKKLDLLLLTLSRIEDLLKALQPLAKLAGWFSPSK